MVKRIKMESRRVVVTGTGVISAIGNNTTDFWKNIVDCKPGIGEYHHPLAEQIRFKNGADVKNFDGTQYLEKGDLDLMDRFAQFAVVAAKEAVHQSSFIVDKENEIKNETKWAHLDIAGVAWKGKGDSFAIKGATGFGLRLLNQFIVDNYE